MKKFIFSLLPRNLPKKTLGYHFFKLILIVSVFLIIPLVGNLRLSYSQPLNWEEAIIEVSPPSPTPKPAKKVFKTSIADNQDVILESKENNPEVKVGSTKLSTLCEGVSESWKLVPNPEVKGQYIICNSGSGLMANVDELNSAQNNYRVNNGLNALSISGELCTIAAERAVEVSKNFSHDGFEVAVDRHSLQKNAVGENIASGPLTAVQFVEWSWDRSSGHKANMLGDWSEGCAGVHDIYAVFIFAR
jgi:hypothetical protein